jgi:NADH-quinone oxidoreductase subunit C
MDREALKTKIISLVAEAQEEENKQFPVFIIPSEKLHSLVEQLKNAEDTAFDYLFCLTGSDMVKNLMVTYHLESTTYHHELVLKVKTEDRETPAFDSITDIYPAAEFYEREVYDMLGIKFNNHPDLRRIFLDEGWKGFPFRKDYTDEVNIVEL